MNIKCKIFNFIIENNKTTLNYIMLNAILCIYKIISGPFKQIMPYVVFRGALNI